jgi:TPR repeat protein
VLDDYAFALSLFRRAAVLGSGTGSLMTGVILYYGLAGERDVDHAFFCMAKFVRNPIAAAHIALCPRDDREWLVSAKQAPRGDDLPEAACEYVGDLFADGVKVPRNLEIASMWYVRQLEKYEKAGRDTRFLLMKIAKVVHEMRSAV